MAELPHTMAGLQREIASGRLSVPVALARQRERAAAIDQRLHCVVSVPAGNDAPTGPLAGIGLAHKDIFDTPDHRPGAGHDGGGPSPGRRAARAIDRLSRRGATQLARLAMAEHACGATGANARQRPCINPWRAEAVVGGSSSGSAVAVASGLAYGSLGTDTAGSVRIPAATCGVIGLKTTHGLVSCDGVLPLAPSLDSVGVLARTTDDVWQMLEAIAERPLAPPPARIARIQAWIPASLDATVADAMRRALASDGAHVSECDVPEHVRLSELAEALLSFEAAQVHRQALIDGQASPAVEAVCLPGLAITAEWAAAVRAQRAPQLRAFVSAHLGDADLLVMPALAHPVPDWAQVTPGEPAFDARRLVGLYRYMGFVNYLGLPALVFPVATDARGLPISVQVLARPFCERNLLAWAAAAERRLFGEQGMPPVPISHL